VAPDQSELKHLKNLYKTSPVEAVQTYCSDLLLETQLSQEKILAVDEFCLQILYQDPKAAAYLAQQRLERYPDFSVEWPLCCLAACYAQLGNRSEVIKYCERGLKLDLPRRAKVNLLCILRKYRSVGAHLREVFEEFDLLVDGVDTLGKVHELAVIHGDLVQAEKFVALIRKCYEAGRIEMPREGPRNNLFWCGHEPTNIQVTRAGIVRHHGDFTTMPPAGFRRKPRKSKEKITIGYLSADFRDHPTSHLMLGAWRHHDRSRFKVVFFDVGWNDNSAVRLELESFCDEIVPLGSLSDEQAAQVIQDAAVDVLIELNGPTQSNRLGILKYRPAPTSIGYLGWPGSYGGDVVDYVIGDDYLWPPESTHHVPEKIIRLPGTYQINDHKHYPAFRESLGQRAQKRLVGDKTLFRFGSVNNINKLTLSTWDVWMHILRECPHSELHILSPGNAAEQNLESAAQGYGVNPERLRWLPRVSHQEHLDRIGRLDLILDTWPYGGHTTTADALAAGVPVLTLEGKNFTGRVSGSLLTAAGLGKSLIAKSEKEYAQIACALYASPDVLKKIYDFMARNLPNSSLFDSVKRTRDLEAVLERLVKNETR